MTAEVQGRVLTRAQEPIQKSVIRIDERNNKPLRVGRPPRFHSCAFYSHSLPLGAAFEGMCDLDGARKQFAHCSQEALTVGKWLKSA